MLLEELEKSDSEGIIHTKLVGSCLTADIYIFYISLYSRPMHLLTEIDTGLYMILKSILPTYVSFSHAQLRISA